MKFRNLSLLVIAFLHGYILWAMTAIAPYWIIRGTPVTDTEVAVRWICLLVIILFTLTANFLLAKLRKETRRLNILLNTVWSFSLVYFPAILLSSLLDLNFIPETTMFGMYRRNPAVLPLELI